MGRGAGGGKGDGVGIKLLSLMVVFREDGLVALPFQRLCLGVVRGGGLEGGREGGREERMKGGRKG